MDENLLSRWKAVARMTRELDKLKREERLPFVYDQLKILLGMIQARLYPIRRPMAELSGPGRNKLPFFEYIALQRQPVAISNVESEGLDLPREIRDWKFPTLLFVPLISRDVALGVLALGSDSEIDLDGDDAELIEAIVPIVTQNLEVENLIQEGARMMRTDKLLERLDAACRVGNLPQILAATADEVHKALEVERTLIFLKRGDEIAITSGLGCPYASGGDLGHDACGSLAQKVAGTRRTEVQNFNGLLDLGLKRPLCIERQVAAVPIATADKVYGVIECFNRTDGKDFEGHQVELLARAATRMAMAIANTELVERVQKAGIDAIQGLAQALDAKDEYTASHSHNVGEYSYRIAAAMGLEPEICERIKLAGILHDLGKIGVPDEVLNKPGKLTDEEFELIKSHPVMTSEILAHFGDLADVRLSAGSHHERWDGFGYPDRLRKDAIPIGGRIICLADAFDTLTSDRKYRSRMSLEFTIQEMRRSANRQFDPDCVEALFVALKDLGEFDLNGNALPSPEDLERMRTEPLPALKPPAKPKPVEPAPEFIEPVPAPSGMPSPQP